MRVWTQGVGCCARVRQTSLVGMFDTFVPVPALACPVCGGPLRCWQGKDGPCLLFVWTQGERRPDSTVDDVVTDGSALPAEFAIYSYDCPCVDPVDAVGRCENGVWTTTRLAGRQRMARRFFT